MNREKIKAIMLANGFKEKDQGGGVMDLSPYVYAAAEAMLAEHTRMFDFGTMVQKRQKLEERLALAVEQRDQEIRLNAELRGKIPDVPHTYASSQSTNCAGCGKHKHTPLRVDPMGGYVCLTCIDQRLEGLLAEESARECEKDWEGCQEVADLPAVSEALAAFSHDSTGDNGVEVVRAVVAALGTPVSALPAMNADLLEILGRPNFACNRIAAVLRVSGVSIANKAEAEQAAVIHWLLGLYLAHGSEWQAKAEAELKRIAAEHSTKQ